VTGAADHPDRRHPLEALQRLLASAAFARAFTVTALGAVFGAFAIQRLAGHVTYITVVAGLCVLGASVLVARRREISLLHLIPLTLVAYAAWALASLLWTTDREATAAGWITVAGLALLAIVIGHIRDTLQTVRALGDVMRWMLGASLIAEILSGVLFDTPFRILGIQGNIAHLGPIQGIFGTRNLLGFATVIALITFVIEWRTQSVRQGVAVFSIVLAGALAVLSDSPTVLVVAVAVGAATAALTLVRHASRRRRGGVQWGLGILVSVVLIVGYYARGPIIRWLGAEEDLAARLTLWDAIFNYVRFKPLQGWGWFGAWAQDEFPFATINAALHDRHASALNAYVDVLLQIGWGGLILFLAFCVIGLVRSWLVASERRSVVYAWTPLMLVALMADSLFESFTLYGFGWVMLVVCAVRAGQSRSWRDRIGGADAGAGLPRVPGTQ
jgi:exopolysaccharide production protein ExoQ